MANAMLDARKEADSYRRIEVITGERRRRRWTTEEKAQIVAESFEEGANISEVARRHSVSRGLLTVWRHKCMTAARIEAPHFVPVRVDNGSGSETSVDPEHFAPRHEALRAASTATARGVIEVELNGARIRVEPGADSATLSAVLFALRGGR